MSIVSIHQPHFLPWLGYYNKIIHSDVFVILEQVQFRKNYFQNRCKIKANNKDIWLSLPVKKSTCHNIDDVEIIDNKKDRVKIIKTLNQNYSKTKYFEKYFSDFNDIILNDELKLSKLNVQLLKKSLQILNIDTKIEFCKNFTKNLDPNLRLIEICKKLKSEIYISGVGGRNYLNVDLFYQNKIEIKWQNFNQNIKYDQLGDEFVSGLSFLDCLFNIGAEETRALIYKSWIPNI